MSGLLVADRVGTDHADSQGNPGHPHVYLMFWATLVACDIPGALPSTRRRYEVRTVSGARGPCQSIWLSSVYRHHLVHCALGTGQRAPRYEPSRWAWPGMGRGQVPGDRRPSTDYYIYVPVY